MISVHTPPDFKLLKESSHTLWSCQQRGDTGLRIIDIHIIKSVIGLIPHPSYSDPQLHERFKDRFYVVEKMGQDLSDFAGIVELDLEDDIDRSE